MLCNSNQLINFFCKNKNIKAINCLNLSSNKIPKILPKEFIKKRSWKSLSLQINIKDEETRHNPDLQREGKY